MAPAAHVARVSAGMLSAWPWLLRYPIGVARHRRERRLSLKSGLQYSHQAFDANRTFELLALVDHTVATKAALNR